ncbi:hypothetical protein KJ840_04375 [Patescibacteria group bacterium]|nr:hypothetical protein [Patescibacteria group bacterium]
MKTGEQTLFSAKSISLAIIKHIFYWPLWWYSGGFLIILKNTFKKIAGAWIGLALDVWLKNIFRPMYGQYDAASRIISFLMRVVQIIFRFIIMAIISAFILLIPIIYLGLPLAAVWQLFIIK